MNRYPSRFVFTQNLLVKLVDNLAIKLLKATKRHRTKTKKKINNKWQPNDKLDKKYGKTLNKVYLTK